MKKIITILTLLLFCSLFTLDGFSQSFYTGAIGVTQSNGGRTRVFADNLTTRQFDRLSILVGVSSAQVFDYNEDQDVVINAATVTSPVLSNFEVTSTIDNSYANLPPNLEVAINLYGWNNGAYILAKMNVKNNEANAINAFIGLEAIPQIGGTYENDILQWDAASSSVLINEGSWSALKFFSGTQTSAEFIDWVTDYANDSLYYHWLTQNSFDSPLTTTVEGGVAILGQNSVPLAPGESTDFYFGIAIGSSQSECIANMDLCAAKYLLVTPVELTSFTATSQNKQVTLNWSTATEINNNGFEIQRSTSNSEFVTVGFVKGAGTITEEQNYSYTDKNMIDGIYSYRLKQIDYNGMYEYSDIIEVDVRSLDNYSLEQNYPNPFNPSTKIAYVLKEKTNVKILVMNALGEEVAVLVNQTQEQGYHQLDFNASNLPSGIYFYSLQTDNFSETKKMLLMK
jgi:hypothetical protein